MRCSSPRGNQKLGIKALAWFSLIILPISFSAKINICRPTKEVDIQRKDYLRDSQCLTCWIIITFSNYILIFQYPHNFTFIFMFSHVKEIIEISYYASRIFPLWINADICPILETIYVANWGRGTREASVNTLNQKGRWNKGGRGEMGKVNKREKKTRWRGEDASGRVHQGCRLTKLEGALFIPLCYKLPNKNMGYCSSIIWLSSMSNGVG